MVIPASDVTRIRTAEHDHFAQVRSTGDAAEQHHVVAMPGLQAGAVATSPDDDQKNGLNGFW